jgi:cell division protein FtsI (penicillin-binding protein 3)
VSLEETEGKPLRRITFLSAVLFAFVLINVGQLFRWQVLEYDYLLGLAKAEHDWYMEIAPLRGTIRDCNGHILALDIFEFEITAAPPMIANPGEVADRLTPLLERPRDEILELLKSGQPHVRLARRVSQQVGETIESWDLRGIRVEPRPKRVCTENDLAAHVLGFVNETDNGYYGVEGYYNQILKGQAGEGQGERDPAGNYIPVGFHRLAPPQNGRDLVLTIDRTIQYMVEAELEEAIVRYGAESGTIIVMEPKTGSILAMANYPSYDPNRFAETPAELFVNPSVSAHYEPGSVFKIITMAAGLDAGVITPQSTFYDSGSVEVGGRTIMNWDRQGHGLVSMTDVLAQSLNVGAAYVSTTLGRERFYTYVRRFGFGRITEVDLASEGPGRLRLPGDGEWHESDLGTNSFGQGLAVTPLQMITAVAAVANDGLMMKPHVLEKIVDGQHVTTFQPFAVRRVISPQVAEQLTWMLVEAVQKETDLAAVPGYKIAGKTGTAQVPIPGGYHPSWTIASFIGYAPPEDPAFIVLVKIDKPAVEPWGSKVAAPVFKAVAEQLFILLGIPPDEARVTGG